MSKLVGPAIRTSLDVICCIALDGVIHGPPLLDQPAQFITLSFMPTRSASCPANLKSSRHSGLMNDTPPKGMSQPTLMTVAPPRPICFIASKSAAMPSLVTLPFIQCHHVCGLAESGGLRKPVSNESAADMVRAKPASPKLINERKILKIKLAFNINNKHHKSAFLSAEHSARTLSTIYWAVN